jgi:hypothetical protein
LLSLFRYHARLVTRHNTLYYLPHLQFSRRSPDGFLLRSGFPKRKAGLRACNNPAAYPMTLVAYYRPSSP